MRTIDWILVFIPLVVVTAFAVYTNRFVKSVADFLSAGRCANRYLLANAKGESESGLSSSMANFELLLTSGFVLNFWDRISYPVALFLAISGFVVYRYRETRALTLAQFFEIRYSRKFRLFMGMLAFVTGVLNYGIFPAISARFFIYFLNLPLTIPLGSLSLSTFTCLMLLYLSCTVFLVLVGGQATMMITCCLEGLYSQLIYVVIAAVVLYLVSWHHIVETMAATPPGESLMNPFDTGSVKDFNIWFILMGICTRVYSTMAMQQKQGFNSAARTPHESRMGGVLGEWRGYARTLVLLILGICAVTYLRNPIFSQQAAPMHGAIHSIGDQYLQKQMSIPIALRFLLPVGIKGLFLSVMIMGLLSGDGGHLHSWGSIFIQDVVLPFRKNPLTPRQHIWMLRASVTGVAFLAFLFSSFFTQTQFIVLWWLLTGAIFTGGAGAAIIGGLYWRKGTTPAVWAATLTGSILGFAGIVVGSFWPTVLKCLGPAFSHIGIHLPIKFWFNNQVSGFIAMIAAAAVYLITSLLTCREDFNLERMLHRGKYAVQSDGPKPPPLRQRLSLNHLLRFDENFSFRDKLVAGSIFWWALTLMSINITIALWNLLFRRWPILWWAHYWLVLAIIIPFAISILTLFWFTIGGLRDMRLFFVALKTMKRDSRDDGRVVRHHNLADEPVANPIRK